MSKSEDLQAQAPSTLAKVADSPLRLVVYPQGGKPEDGIEQNEPPFKLCHCAEHRLYVKAPDGSKWVEQKLALYWQAGRPDSYRLRADPSFLFESTLPPEDERSFKKLSRETGANWVLTAMGGEAAQSGENLKLALGSYWQAPKYGFLVHVGDFHYAVTELQWNNVVPVVDPPTAAILTATVTSPYDADRVMSGKPVCFELNGEPYGDPILTGDDGMAHLLYTPQPEEIGAENRVTINAYCVDELGETSERISRTLPAFASNGWPDQLKVELRDSEGLVPSTALGVRLTRGVTYTVTLIPEKGSAYVDQPTKLMWPEGEAQLGIDLTPPAGEPEDGRPLPEAGLSWTLRGGDEKSGQFTLSVVISALEMPFLLRGTQMSAELADEADLEVAIEVEGAPPIFHRGVDKAVCIKPKDGSPLARMELAATLHFGQIEDEFAAGQVPADPGYEKPSEKVTEEGVKWLLRPKEDGNSGQFGLKVEVPGFTTGLRLEKALALSSGLVDEAQVFIDESNIPLGGNVLVLRRGTQLTIKLKPREHSGLGRTQLKGWITFDSGTLDPRQVPSDPGYKDKQDMAKDGLSWTLTGGDVSGSLSLTIHVEGFERAITLAKVMLLSNKLTDEATVKIDEEAPSTVNCLRHNKPRNISIVPKHNSPLGQSGLECHIAFIEGTLTSDSVKAIPGYGDKIKIVEGTLAWCLEGLEGSGTFAIGIHVEGFDDTLQLTDAILLSQRLSDEAVLKVDGEEVPSMALMVSMPRKVSLELLPNSPLGLAELDCWMSFESDEVPAESVSAKPCYGNEERLLPTGLEWELEGVDVSGRFTLIVKVKEFEDALTLSGFVGGYADYLELTSENETVWPGLFLWQGETTKVKLRNKEGSPLPINHKIKAALLLKDTGTLEPNNLWPRPYYDVYQTDTIENLSWDVKAWSVRGWSDLAVKIKDYDPVIEGKALLLSGKPFDEAYAKYHIYHMRGAGSKDLGLVIRPDSPLEMINLKAKLVLAENEYGGDFKVEPRLGEWVDVGQEMWTITVFDESSGYLTFDLLIEGYKVPLKVTAIIGQVLEGS